MEDLGSNQVTWDCYAWFTTAGNHTGIGSFYVAPLLPIVAGGGGLSEYTWSFLYHKDGSAGTPTSTPCPPGGPCPSNIQP